MQHRHAVSWSKQGKNACGVVSLWALGQKSSSILERMQRTSLLGGYSKGDSDTRCREAEVPA